MIGRQARRKTAKSHVGGIPSHADAQERNLRVTGKGEGPQMITENGGHAAGPRNTTSAEANPNARGKRQ